MAKESIIEEETFEMGLQRGKTLTWGDDGEESCETGKTVTPK